MRSARLFLALTLLLAGAPAWSATGPVDGDVVGREGATIAQQGDDITELARRFDVGFVELRAANPGVPASDIPGGTMIRLPTAHLLPAAPRRGIVINLAELRLYVFPVAGGTVSTYPISVGRSGWETPAGATFVTRKEAGQTWYPPPSIRAENPALPHAVPPGPSNPLGAFAVYLDWPRYLIHGTNRPSSIGRRVSHGCIRLYPEDIAELYRQAAVGMPVSVVDQPLKIGHDAAGTIYLEVHPTARQNDQIERDGVATHEPPAGLIGMIAERLGGELDRIDWNAVRAAAAERGGMPVRISR